MRFDLVQPLLELCAARLHKSGLAMRLLNLNGYLLPLPASLRP
jgi:hypothetical protein